MVTQSQLNALSQQHSQSKNITATDGGQEDLMAFLSGGPSISASFDTTGTMNSNSVDDVRKTRPQRKTPSMKSMSSTRSRSKASTSGGLLDSPNFAPPPLLNPSDNVKTMYELNAEHEANYALLPNYEKIRHSGNIMTRFSAVSLMTKKWRQNFWILYGDILYFFRSREDFDSWLLNPYLSRDERAALVKRYLNFRDPESKYFIVGKLNMKFYRRKGMMYHFKLDKHYVRGDNVSLHLVGAFASMNENDVSELHTLIRYMLKGNSSVIFGGGPHSDNQSAYSSDYAFTDGRNSTVSAGF